MSGLLQETWLDHVDAIYRDDAPRFARQLRLPIEVDAWQYGPGCTVTIRLAIPVMAIYRKKKTAQPVTRRAA